VPRVHIGLPLCATGHSLVVFAAVFGLAALIAPRLALGLSWPFSNFALDGVAWWTPWLLWSPYAALVGSGRQPGSPE
jgi:hypothetical protein